MAITSKELGSRLWKIANKQRGSISAGDYKDYILGFIFYKDISEQMENMADKALENDEIKYISLTIKDTELLEAIKKEAIKKLGYFISPWELYNQILKSDNEDIPFVLDKLKKVFENIEQSTIGETSEDDFINLFEKLDLTNSNLGDTVEDKNKLIFNTMKEFSNIDLSESDTDILGDAYEYLIGKFASSNDAGEHYTPQQISKLLVRLTTSGNRKIKKVYDPTCGSGSLLLKYKKVLNYTPEFFGQELNPNSYNLARMNMIMHNISYNKFDIKKGDTLEKPKHIEHKFDTITANPPYSTHWSRDTKFLQDERFSQYGKLAPKTKADFAFVQHMVYHLDEEGTMAVVLPHGVLFRTGDEGVIRKYLIKDKNYIDTIIGLPSDMFFGTNISTVIIVIKKCRKEDKDILFIDASQEFNNDGDKNILTDENIEKIIDVFEKRTIIDKYSYSAKLSEIEDNNYNLNISRYVDTFEEEEEIDLKNLSSKIKLLDTNINNNNIDINNFCKELNIDSPLGV